MYIKRTIQSIINQTIGFDSIELILVDDCSTDSSRDIIEEFTKQYNNIKLFVSDKNHGFPGYGRNVGINESNADYIMFIDNDDEYCPTFCETVYDAMIKNPCDVVSANYLFIQNGNVIKKNVFDSVAPENEHNLFAIDLDGFYNFKSDFIWTKIFKKSTIVDNNIKFVEDRWNEDGLFLHEFYYYANKLICINYYGYKWYRDGSNLSFFSLKSTIGILNSYYDIYNLLKSQYDSVDYDTIFKSSIEGTIIRICMCYGSINEMKCLLSKLYDFEKFIDFNSSLPHFWATFVNKFILWKHFNIVAVMLVIIRKVKLIIDLINK